VEVDDNEKQTWVTLFAAVSDPPVFCIQPDGDVSCKLHFKTKIVSDNA